MYSLVWPRTKGKEGGSGGDGGDGGAGGQGGGNQQVSAASNSSSAQTYLGLMKFYRRFLRLAAQVLKLLTNSLKMEQQASWSSRTACGALFWLARQP